MAQPVPNDSDFRVGRENDPTKVKKWQSACGGMVSTMADYARFVQMLLDGGKFDGKTYLKPEAFKQMATDHDRSGRRRRPRLSVFPRRRFRFRARLSRVRTDPGNAKPPPPGDLGELKWDGASGCYFVVDRKQDMFFVLMEQTP